MRTKNLNLKKKIAFIASVAMIATSTAAYLPVEASPATQISGAIDLTDATKHGYDDAAKASGAAVDAKINTFDTFVKVDGEYLAANGTTEYKTFGTIAEAKGTDYNIVSVNDIIATEGTALGITNNANNVEQFAAVGNTLELPYEVVKPGSVVELEFAARKEGALADESITSVKVTLDDKGMAKVPNKTKPVIAQSDDSTYDTDTETMTASTDGSYETFDVSGLIVQAGSAITQKGMGTPALETLAGSINIVDENAAINKVDAKTTDYQVKKIGDVYANVVKVKLTGVVDSGAPVVINTGVNANWTVSGTGVSNKKLTLYMGENGYVESGLITYTKGTESEYYVFYVEAANTIFDGANYAPNDDSKFAKNESEDDIAFKIGAGGTVGTLDSITEQLANVKYKVKRTTTTETIGTQKKLVTLFTVYNNEKPENKDQVITLKTTDGTLDLVGDYAVTEAAGTNSDKKYSKTDGTATLSVDDYAEITAGGGKTKDENIAAFKAFNTAEMTATTQGNFETPVIEYTNAVRANGTKYKADTVATQTYFKIKFTTDYDILLDDGNDNTNKDNPEKDGKVSVSGREMSKPDDAERAGYTFGGWSYTETNSNGDANNAVFTTASDKQLVKDANITPNTTLHAIWRGDNYTIKFNANGGIKNAGDAAPVTGTYTPVDFDADNNAIEWTYSATSDSDLDTLADIAEYSGLSAVRPGYKFLGWAKTADATEELTDEELEEVKPAKNGTVTLYAVWEANDNIQLGFKELAFDADGLSITTSLDSTDVDYTVAASNDNTVNAFAEVYTNTNAKFATGAEGIKVVTSGTKLGELPTPVKAGYTFDAWYIAKCDKESGLVTAEKVDAETNVDDIFDRVNTKAGFGTLAGNTKAQTITLYAGFVQKVYKIEYDLGDGAFESAYTKDTSTRPVNYKFKNGTLVLLNAKGGESEDDMKTTPTVGSGTYYVFDYWTINDGTAKVTSTNLKKTISELETASDITIHAHYKKSAAAATQGRIFIDPNEGAVYQYDDAATAANEKGYTELERAAYPEITGSASQNVSASWTIEKNKIVSNSNSKNSFIVARPGYTFTGWYTDKECKTPYTFGKYPDKTEINVYAGWKAASSTKYKINFNLINKNTSYVAKSDKDGLDASDDSDFTFSAEFGGTTGSTVKASDKNFEVNGKTYNFSSKASSGLITEKELKAEYRLGYVKDAIIIDSFDNDTAADKIATAMNAKDAKYPLVNGDTYSALGDAAKEQIASAEGVEWVFKANVDDADMAAWVGDGTDKTKNAKTGLATGNFVLDTANYTVIQGNYVEDYVDEPENPNPQEEDLEAATDVKVAGGVVTWKAAKGAASYRYKVIDKNGNVKYAAATVKGTSQTLAVADIPADDYKLAVIAIAKDGKTTKTTEPIEVKAVKTNLTAPTEVKWADGVLTWKASTDAHHHNVKKVYANGNVKYVGGTADATLDLAAESVDFTAYVIAVDANGKTATSTKGAKVAADSKKVLGVVTDAKYDAKDNTVSWTAVANAKSYNICKMVNGKKFWVTGVKDTSYKFENKTPAFNYYVVAVAEDGDYTIGTFNAYPTMATDVVVTEGSKKVTWTAAEGAKYYKIGKVSADGKKVVWNNNKIEGTEGTFSYACTAGQKVVVMAVFKDEAKNLQTTRSATVVAAAAKADK